MVYMHFFLIFFLGNFPFLHTIQTLQFINTTWHYTHYFGIFLSGYISGADPGFQVRGGALKKIAPSGGRREYFWGISCEKSLFYAKKSYFFQLRREARKLLEYFVWKITILRQKIIFSPILGGGGRPPLDPPLYIFMYWINTFTHNDYAKFYKSRSSG
jgi:hypothetical protein